MKAFFKTHTETVLVFSAIIFIVVIFWFLFATIQVVVSEVNHAVVTPTAAPEQGFDLRSVAHVDFRGIDASSSAASVPPAEPAPAAMTSTGSEASAVPATSTGPASQ